eukprot:1222106-Amphidinium_carterae.1
MPNSILPRGCCKPITRGFLSSPKEHTYSTAKRSMRSHSPDQTLQAAVDHEDYANSSHVRVLAFGQEGVLGEREARNRHRCTRYSKSHRWAQTVLP